MKKFLFLLLSAFFYLFSFTFAVTVEVPGDGVIVRDGNVPNATIAGDDTTIIDLVKQINDYLRFSIGAICLAVALYAGYQIIMSQGDKTKLKKGNDMLVGALIGVFIAIFSYVLIRLVVNLF